MDLSDLRRDFGKFGLDLNKLPGNPADLLERWLTEAEKAGIGEFNAMVLSTVSRESRPSSRIVLLKEVTRNGSLIFYTNYRSRKGKELMMNRFAAVNFFWRELERQIRIEGEIKKTSREISRAYFKSRPLESQLSALISPQSEPIKDLASLRQEAERIFVSGAKIDLPDHWGGYELTPDCFEFWQGGKNRLHDRIRYTRQGLLWHTDRLAP
jgi:pyridoxamine 5'-phosphate oxidase